MRTNILPVHGYAGVRHARKWVKEIAREIGFNSEPQEVLEFVVNELATNLMVHQTIKGEIILRHISGPSNEGIEIVARDLGPGIPDLKSTIRGDGPNDIIPECGLSAVKKMMDEFDIYSHTPVKMSRKSRGINIPHGTVVTARKWIVDHDADNSFKYNAFSRPFTDEAHNSDNYFVDTECNEIFIAVADGLEHGPKGHLTAKKVIECVKHNRKLKFGNLLLKAHTVLGRTQKAALTLIKIKHSDHVLTHAGVGNIKTRIFQHGQKVLSPGAGTLGEGQLPRISVNKIQWPSGGVLVVFSDGLSDKWNINEIPDYNNYHVSMLCNLLIREHGLKNRDTTVVVVKAREGEER